MKRIIHALIISSLLLAYAITTHTVAQAAGQNSCPADRPVARVSVVSDNGGRPSWSPDGKALAFDRRDANGYFGLYVMAVGGGVTKSLTKGVFPIPQRNSGNPAWHPSGKYIIFEAEEDKHYDVIDKYPGNPGVGVYANFWATTPDGRKYWKLTNTPAKLTLDDGLPFTAILNPHFNSDGTKMVWSERYAEGGKWGKWRLMIADFTESQDGPNLVNTHVAFQPADGKGNYVTALAFSADGKKLLVAGNLEGQDEFGLDLYTLDLTTGQYTNLTNTPDVWEEDAAFSPNNQKIAYMSNIGSPLDSNNAHWTTQKQTREYWLMNSDGSNKQQLTCFNVQGAPEYIPQNTIVGAVSFSPDGKHLAAMIGVDQGTKDRADYHLKLAMIDLK